MRFSSTGGDGGLHPVEGFGEGSAGAAEVEPDVVAFGRTKIGALA
jgi:hypothetical protein